MIRRMKKYRFWILIAGLCLLALLVYNTPGFSFSGYLIFGLALLLTAFRLLRRLEKRFRRTARWLRGILVVCLCTGLVLATLTGIRIGSAAAGSDEEACEYVIVLGAGVNGTQPSLILSERIGRAYDYLTAHPQSICIVSGGQGAGEDITEAQCMYDRLTAMGIDGQRIWLEDKSTSTRENIRFSLELIRQRTGSAPERAAVISNEFHIFRAGMVARTEGLQAVGVPAKTGWLLLRINYFLREIPAVWYYTISGG